MNEEDLRDDDVVDPEDTEVEIEEDEAEADFNPNATVVLEEDESSEPLEGFPTEEVIEETPDADIEEGESLVDHEPSGTELAEVTAEYKILQPGAHIVDSYGMHVRTLQIDTVEELPVEIGDSFVDRGLAEKVQ